MPAHTPGPWHWSLGKFVAADDGQLVADTQTVADARLIAAAPRMLEALELIEYWGRAAIATPSVDVKHRIWQEACAAIAQAKGETA